MARFRAPVADSKKIMFLEKSLEMASYDESTGKKYLSPNTVLKITALIPEYKISLGHKQNVFKKKMGAVGQKDKALAKLKLICCDFWEVLKRRTVRMGHSTSIFILFGLPTSGKVTFPTTKGNWIPVAEHIIYGEGELVKQGYPPMTNPAIDELTALCEIAAEKYRTVQSLEGDLVRALEVVKKIRKKADKLIWEIMQELRFGMRHNTKSNQRRVMKHYGAEFEYYPKKNTEEDSDI